MTWIQTLKGGAFDYVALLRGETQHIDLEEVAWCLARKPRYGGHTNPTISVAEHSIAVAKRVAELAGIYGLNYPFDRYTNAVRCGLLHDAQEAYCGDVSRPMKMLFRQESWVDYVDSHGTRHTERCKPTSIYDHVERAAEANFARRFDLRWTLEIEDIVKQADNECCAFEKRIIMGEGPREHAWQWLPSIPGTHVVKVAGLSPEEAQRMFMLACRMMEIA